MFISYNLCNMKSIINIKLGFHIDIFGQAFGSDEFIELNESIMIGINSIEILHDVIVVTLILIILFNISFKFCSMKDIVSDSIDISEKGITHMDLFDEIIAKHLCHFNFKNRK